MKERQSVELKQTYSRHKEHKQPIELIERLLSILSLEKMYFDSMQSIQAVSFAQTAYTIPEKMTLQLYTWNMMTYHTPSCSLLALKTKRSSWIDLPSKTFHIFLVVVILRYLWSDYRNPDDELHDHAKWYQWYQWYRSRYKMKFNAYFRIEIV